MDEQHTDADVRASLLKVEEKVNAIYESVEKTRRYFLYTFIATIVVVVLPAIGIVFALPAFLGTYSSISDISALGL